MEKWLCQVPRTTTTTRVCLIALLSFVGCLESNCDDNHEVVYKQAASEADLDARSRQKPTIAIVTTVSCTMVVKQFSKRPPREVRSRFHTIKQLKRKTVGTILGSSYGNSVLCV